MLPRFLVPDLDPAQTHAVLPRAEAHHLARVLRLKRGDEVCVFDGRGREFKAHVVNIARDAVTVMLLERSDAVPLPRIALTLVQSVLKADGMDAVIRDSTMIGVHTVEPVLSERTTLKTALLPKAHERWRRIALASAKQCGRPTLPDIREPRAFGAWLGSRPSGDAFLLVEPSMALQNTVRVRDLIDRPAPDQASMVVGPEGGWTEAERNAALEAGCVPLSIGRLTLRADAMPLVAAAVLLAIWSD